MLRYIKLLELCIPRFHLTTMFSLIHCLHADWPRPGLVPQVTVQYRQDRGAMVPLRVHTIVVSVQHDENICLEAMCHCLKEQVVKAVVPSAYLDDETIYHLQPSGRFVIGGPQVRQEAPPPKFECRCCSFVSIAKYLIL